MKIIGRINSHVLFPTILSLFIVFTSQAVRYFFNYPLYPKIFIIPCLVFIFLLLVSFLAFPEKNSILFREESIIYKKKKIYYLINILLFGLIGVRLIGVVWGSGYLTPLFEAQYKTGNAHIDTLFHSAISNMLMYFGKPSLGIEGVVLQPYHYGIHLVMGFFSRILGIRVLESFHLVYPPLILPIFFGLFIILSENIYTLIFPFRKKEILKTVELGSFFFIIAGILPESVLRDAGSSNNSTFISESQAFAISMLFLSIIVFIRLYKIKKTKKKLFFLILFSFINTIVVCFSKISIGTLWVVALCFFWLENYKKADRLLIFIISGIAWLFSVSIVNVSSGAKIPIFFAHYLRNYVERDFWPLFPLIHYGWTFIALFLLFRAYADEAIEKRNFRIFLFCLGGVSIISCLPGLFLPIGGGSAYYFSSLNWWISLPVIVVFLVPLFPEIRNWWDRKIHLPYLKVLIIFIAVSLMSTSGINTMNSIYSFHKANKKYTKKEDNNSKLLWDIAMSTKQSLKKPKAFVYDKIIPYGTRGPDNKRAWMISFLSTAAISGVPTLNEIEPYFKQFDQVIGYTFDKFVNIDHRKESYDKFDIVNIKIQENIDLIK